MFTLIFIIVLVVILWPLIGSGIASLFNGVVMIISCPIYWALRVFKRPKDKSEDDKLTKWSVAMAMFIIVAAFFTYMIIKTI